ncbi:hypothetical protein Tco_0071351 [Tanacetum coccineum]
MYGESNTYVIEDLTVTAGNPIKEVLLMNLPDHMYNIYTVKWSSWNRRSSKSNENYSIGEIVILDEEEVIASFQDKYEHVGQKHKMVKNVNRDDSRK